MKLFAQARTMLKKQGKKTRYLKNVSSTGCLYETNLISNFEQVLKHA